MSYDLYHLDNISQEIDKLMDLNQAMAAWELVKDTDHPLKDRVYEKVKHAFNYDIYREFYEKHLVEFPVPEDMAYDCTKLYPRFNWLIKEIEKSKPSEVLDIGCADGYLGLTLSGRGIKSTGLNLYKPSVALAIERAKKKGLTVCSFIHQDFFEHKGKYESVVFFDIFEHLPDPKRGLDKALSLTKKTLYFSTPRDDHMSIEEHLRESNREGWDDGKPAGHLKLWGEQELRQFLSSYKVRQFIVNEWRDMLVEIEI